MQLDLYRLAVEMADRLSARRATANSFFLTLNTGLVALLGANDLRWDVAAAGVVFAVAWWALLKSYRDLNAAKFEVILAMEADLPVAIYGREWELLSARPSRYRELGRVERVVPWLFAAIYAFEAVRSLVA